MAKFKIEEKIEAVIGYQKNKLLLKFAKRNKQAESYYYVKYEFDVI
ncbi:hypothetical protein [Bacillus coreaensis]